MAYTPFAAKESLSSWELSCPRTCLSRRSKASGRLKSDWRASLFLASSSSFSSEICSLKARTSSFSSSTLSGEYLLEGELVDAPKLVAVLEGDELEEPKFALD